MNPYLKSESGQGLSEYLILVLLIAIGSIAAARSIGAAVNEKLTTIRTEIHNLNFQSSTGQGSGTGSGGNSGI